MTLPELLKLVRQRWWILIILPAVFVLAAYFISSAMTPIYEAEATVIVEHQLAGGSLDLQSIQAAERRTQTFSQLISTRSVIAPVIEDLGLDLTVEHMRENLSVSHMRDSQLITITFQDPDPEHAAEVVNAMASRFGEYVREIQVPVLGLNETEVSGVLEQLDEQIATIEGSIAELEADEVSLSAVNQERLADLEASLTALEQSRNAFEAVEETIADVDSTLGSQVYVAEPASPPTDPISPRTMMNVALAGMLGLLLAGGVTVGLGWLDDNIKTEADLRGLISYPIIGTVPAEDLPERVESIHAGRSVSGEIFRGLRTNLQFMMVDRDVKSLVVTSSSAGEGKTTIAANLAIVLAQGGQRVILVDADMRRPRVQGMFDRIRNDRGLSNLLLQSPAVIEEVVQSTTIKNLKVLTTGPVPPNPPDLLGSGRMRALINALEDNADIVVFDCPPVAISESLLLSSMTDGIVFVVRASKNRTSEIVEGVEAASQTGVPILGMILNGVPKDSQAAYRVYQQYYPLAEREAEIPRSGSRFGRIGRLFSKSSKA